MAETEVPSDAPQSPPTQDTSETDSGDELLPSQRAKLAGGKEQAKLFDISRDSHVFFLESLRYVW